MKRLTPLLFGLIGLCAFQVQAHTRLSAATPANETVIEAAPTGIVLEFNAEVLSHTINRELHSLKESNHVH